VCCRNYQVIDAEAGTLENVVDLGLSQVGDCRAGWLGGFGWQHNTQHVAVWWQQQQQQQSPTEGGVK
jgi:hypothetical protein